MPKLSDHDLKQMDSAWLQRQSDEVIRGLCERALEDLRAARDRLNQNPNNSSRPSGSMPPWQRTGIAKAIEALASEPSKIQGTQPSPSEGAHDTIPADTPVPEKGDAQANLAKESLPQTPKRPGRPTGAQGHGRTQKLAPTASHKKYPTHCSACQRTLTPDASAKAWSGWDSLDLADLQADANGAAALGLRVEVTRHLLMQQRCSCGHETQAQPCKMPGHADWVGVDIGEQRLLGPRLAATVVYLRVRMRLPCRKVQELLLELFGLELSAAVISQTLSQAARSVEPLHQQLVQELEQAVLIHADETSWSEAGQALWLWVLCCSHTVMYVIGTRGKEMFDNALGLAWMGWLMSDGYGAYRSRQRRLRCWAHLVRKLRGIAQSTTPGAQRVGGEMLQLVQELMQAVYEARQAHLQAHMAAPEPPSATHQRQIEALHQLCQQHSQSTHQALGAVAREFLNDWQAIVQVLSEPGLPLTNNAAERQLRHYVIARRISYGTRNLVGSNSMAMVASVVDTCRIRGAHMTDLLAKAIHAARMGLPAPAMPPIPDHLLGKNGALVGL